MRVAGVKSSASAGAAATDSRGSVERRPVARPGLEGLERRGGAEDVRLAVPATHDLEPDGELLAGEPTRQVGRRVAGQVKGIHEGYSVKYRVGRLAAEIREPL